ncbi:tRNA (adenosine(37)-N6)-threonylcarbamoyltransferase complex dimerization subunit type 1 TsaB [bacterium]|nr:tRNA (adenosine(37)-N6)-threonylcarbamoyltransferase complex dimerization subunit type 1 TsaB [bacterium]NBX82441.1 tRNA (adenosine(37)-N6)-threonylcarbamoyltransferase complex dimerization subunit type 1 TsaB [bacterium]
MNSIGLALDLSGPTGSFALFDQNAPSIPLVEKELLGSFTHSELLLAEIERTLREHAFKFKDISEWVVSSGPGSFTGLRIAFSTLKAFVFARGGQLVTVSGPEARAWGYLTEKKLPQAPESLLVLSYLTADKWVASDFVYKNQRLILRTETIVNENTLELSKTSIALTEERIAARSKNTPAEWTIFPLRARHLCSFSSLESKKVFLPHELSQVTPLYLGSSHFE